MCYLQVWLRFLELDYINQIRFLYLCEEMRVVFQSYGIKKKYFSLFDDTSEKKSKTYKLNKTASNQF